MKRSLLYVIFLLVVTVVTLELSPFILAPVFLNQSYSRTILSSDFQRQEITGGLGESVDEIQEEEYLGEHILHPYLGFVSVPRSDFNKYCFPGSDPLTSKSDRTVNVCLTGGSVATGLYEPLKKILNQSLSQTEEFKNKEINLVMFALGGFKQPQQLMSLNYFLYLGAHYDLVINVDGFNEIVLPYSDNLPFNVHSSYPRHWNFYSRKRLDSNIQLLLARQISLKEEKSKLKTFFNGKKLYISNFGLFIWKFLDNKKANSIYGVEEKLRQSVMKSESGYQSTGPSEIISDTTRFFENQAKSWQRASVLMAELGSSHGFDYFHFLQPNQYLTGSKQLTNEELEFAYEDQPFVYKEAVIRGYPLLIKEGKRLLGKDIKFYDLTFMFKNENRTVYNDKCCHFNALGYHLISEKISDEIVRFYQQTGKADVIN